MYIALCPARGKNIGKRVVEQYGRLCVYVPRTWSVVCVCVCVCVWTELIFYEGRTTGTGGVAEGKLMCI